MLEHMAEVECAEKERMQQKAERARELLLEVQADNEKQVHHKKSLVSVHGASGHARYKVWALMLCWWALCCRSSGRLMRTARLRSTCGSGRRRSGARRAALVLACTVSARAADHQSAPLPATTIGATRRRSSAGRLSGSGRLRACAQSRKRWLITRSALARSPRCVPPCSPCANPWQAELDALRAKRAAEAAMREARQRELREAERRARQVQEMEESRLMQQAIKQRALTIEARRQREEFERNRRVRSAPLRSCGVCLSLASHRRGLCGLTAGARGGTASRGGGGGARAPIRDAARPAAARASDEQ